MENFETYLMDKYPNLFYKNEKGESECPCGASAPEGWHAIIDELCGCIHNHVYGTSRSELEVHNKLYYFWKFLSKAVTKVHLFIILKLFKKLNTAKFNAPWSAISKKFNYIAHKYAKYISKRPPEVKIDQIKEKFGDLRFYITGGDSEVNGMISFAEYLCRRTCEVSGEKGELHVRGSWFKTLAPKTIENDIYKGYTPTKK